MYLKRYVLLQSVLTISLVGIPRAEEGSVLFREDFNDLDNWKPVFFPKIKQHSTYVIHRDGDIPVLKAESRASASALMHRETFNVYAYPLVTWRWKVDNVYSGGDARTKQGDDYPLRVYIMFVYDPDNAGFLEKVKYASYRIIYGEYPPHSILNYIWANRSHPARIITSSYTDKAKLILLQMGSEKCGTWQTERINIVDDYLEAFGSKPPERAVIALMNDSDNTGERSVSYLDYIEVYRDEAGSDS